MKKLVYSIHCELILEWNLNFLRSVPIGIVDDLKSTQQYQTQCFFFLSFFLKESNFLHSVLSQIIATSNAIDFYFYFYLSGLRQP